MRRFTATIATVAVFAILSVSGANAQQSLRKEVETYVINPCYGNAYGSRNVGKAKQLTRSAVNQVTNNVIAHVRDLQLSDFSSRKRLYAAYVRECRQMLR